MISSLIFQSISSLIILSLILLQLFLHFLPLAAKWVVLLREAQLKRIRGEDLSQSMLEDLFLGPLLNDPSAGACKEALVYVGEIDIEC